MRNAALRHAALIGAVTAGLSLASLSVSAQYTGPQAAGPAGAAVNVPSAHPVISSVADALKAAKDAQVSLDGRIVNRIKHEHYTFEDATGRIEIELDDKLLPPGVQINEKTRVRITGEVDRHRMRANDIDVKHFEVLP